MSSLQQKRILLTRSSSANERLTRLFEDRGAVVLSVPSIEILDPTSWEPLDTALRRLAEYSGILFTSANTVAKFIGRVRSNHPTLVPLPITLRLYAVGEATAEALTDSGLTVAATAELAGADGLARMFRGEDVAGRRFLFPKSEIARDVLPGKLRDLGAVVDEVVVYRTVPPSSREMEKLREHLKSGVDVVTFFSPSAVNNVVQMVGAAALKSVPVAAIGPTTAETARRFGLTVGVVAKSTTAESLVDAVESYLQKQ